MENKKNYYAIIPANVRYDKELSLGARMLYGEITALCNEKGYCWASNSYFAELYQISERTISRWISILSEKHYVEISIEYKNNTKEILNRYLKILPNIIASDPIDKNVYTYRQKCLDPIDKNVLDNNTYSNNTNEYNNSINTIIKEKPKKNDLDLSLLPPFINKDIFDKFVKLQREKRRKITKTQYEEMIANLIKLYNSGEDVNQCIKNSIAGGYQNIFPCKKSGYFKKYDSVGDQIIAVGQEWVREEEEKERLEAEKLRKMKNINQTNLLEYEN